MKAQLLQIFEDCFMKWEAYSEKSAYEAIQTQNGHIYHSAHLLI